MSVLSLIVPCYNEEAAIPFFYEEATRVLKGMDVDYEIVFVDDGSSDGTLKKLMELSEKDEKVVYLSFSRNFGKEAAMYAGFCNIKGDYVVVLDADLQHPPELLPEMLSCLQNEDYDSVATRRVDRKGEPPIRSWFARMFYKLINRISDAEIVDGAQDFRLMKRDMVDAIISMSEYNRFSKGIFSWVGFKTKWLPHENKERVAGESKWSFSKLFRYAIEGIMSFTQAPLNIASWLGLVVTAFSFIYMAFIIVKYLMYGDPVAGWATTICVILFMGGLQLCILGIIGSYLAKTYLETKKRPHFIIAESNRKDVKKIG